MSTLENIQSSTQIAKLLGRVSAAVEQVASDTFKNAVDANDPALAWVKRAWWIVGQKPLIQWYAQRALEHAVHQTPSLQAAIDANPSDPQVTDAAILSFVQTFITRCVTLNI